jgi:hypothetical protein
MVILDAHSYSKQLGGINRRRLGEAAAARILRENDMAGRHLKMQIKYIFVS